MEAEPSTSTEPAEGTFLDDSEYVPVEDLVVGLVVDDAQQIDEATGLVVTLEKLATEFPIELRIDAGESGLRLTTAPPTQHVETSILPVWHQLRVTVVRESEVEADDAAR